MSRKPNFLDRRTMIGASLATLLLPPVAKAQQWNDPASQRATDMNIRMTFGHQTMTATLCDNPSARDFHAMLPLDLTIEDFGHNEKIAHLPHRLTEEGSGPFGNEQPGDLCYYKPWGNLAMFYAPYQHPGLIRLGRFDSFRPLLTKGAFPLRVERIEADPGA